MPRVVGAAGSLRCFRVRAARVPGRESPLERFWEPLGCSGCPGGCSDCLGAALDVRGLLWTCRGLLWMSGDAGLLWLSGGCSGCPVVVLDVPEPLDCSGSLRPGWAPSALPLANWAGTPWGGIGSSAPTTPTPFAPVRAAGGRGVGGDPWELFPELQRPTPPHPLCLWGQVPVSLLSPPPVTSWLSLVPTRAWGGSHSRLGGLAPSYRSISALLKPGLHWSSTFQMFLQHESYQWRESTSRKNSLASSVSVQDSGADGSTHACMVNMGRW
ncbi:uncharacterized protein [Notamacropus eugenii]|uniref:uncharacterized protein n=1 Tax=Notamacropus eugenii TaxID=9315 RepID=UPI003B671746